MERQGPVLLVTLNRPQAANSWTAEMDTVLTAALRAADDDPAVRAVVLTGAGRHFCVGADLAGLGARVGPPAGPAAAGPGQAPSDPAAFLPSRDWAAWPPSLRVPVVAAITGGCAGIGLALAAQCDLRVVAHDARLATAFARRGLVAEHGLALLLPRLVGAGRAADLLLSGRTFSGADAAAWGFAQQVHPAPDVLPAALAWAHDVADNCSPSAVATIKRQLLDGLDPVGWQQRVQEADIAMRAAFAAPDAAEGITAWLQRRRAIFAARAPGPG